MARQYKNQKNAEIEQKISDMLNYMPDFCHGYIVSISGYNKPLTQLAYLQRIQFFLNWLLDYNSYFAKKYSSISNFTIEDIKLLKKADFEEFLHHIDVFGALSKSEIIERKKIGKVTISSKTSTRNNYLSALRSLYSYLIDNEYIESSAVLKIRQRKPDKTIPIALDDYQVDKVMNVICGGSEFLTKQQEKSRLKTTIRDTAIYILALHTGIRVSELVSLDIDDIDFRQHCFKVIRKRGKEDTVYFDDTTENALQEWLIDRKNMLLPDDERALFVSTSGSKIGSRLSVRSVERMVKKYTQIGAPEVTGFHAHSLRSSCGTKIIEKTGGDINYTKNVLGHESIMTTTRYIKDNEQQKIDRRTLLDE